jgi:hypothetical protein
MPQNLHHRLLDMELQMPLKFIPIKNQRMRQLPITSTMGSFISHLLISDATRQRNQNSGRDLGLPPSTWMFSFQPHLERIGVRGVSSWELLQFWIQILHNVCWRDLIQLGSLKMLANMIWIHLCHLKMDDWQFEVYDLMGG